MSRSINEVRILGRLGNEPEVRVMPNINNKCVANISVATTEYWKDRESGEQQESTEWHRMVAFGRNAEIIRDYVKKGQQHYFTGKLKTRKWSDKDGNDRYTTEIVIDDIVLLPQGSGNGSQAAGSDQQQGNQSMSQPSR